MGVVQVHDQDMTRAQAMDIVSGVLRLVNGLWHISGPEGLFNQFW
jgi:hypothetical protein